MSTEDSYISPCSLYYIIGLEIKKKKKKAKKVRPLETNILWATGREQKSLEEAPLSEVFAMTVNKLSEAHSSSSNRRPLLFREEPRGEKRNL